MAAALVVQNAVSKKGDDALLLTYFLQTGEVLPKKGRGTALSKAHTKRVAAAALGVDMSDVPMTIDGSQDLVMDLALPKRGFKRSAFATNSERIKAIAEAYVSVGRAEAADALRSKLVEIEDGMATCDADIAQIVMSSGSDLLRQTLQSELGVDCSMVLKRDCSARPRILFHVADVMLRPDYVSVVSVPANRARQVFDILEATKDLRERWDSAAEGAGLSSIQSSSQVDECWVAFDERWIAFGESGTLRRTLEHWDSAEGANLSSTNPHHFGGVAFGEGWIAFGENVSRFIFHTPRSRLLEDVRVGSVCLRHLADLCDDVWGWSSGSRPSCTGWIFAYAGDGGRPSSR